MEVRFSKHVHTRMMVRGWLLPVGDRHPLLQVSGLRFFYLFTWYQTPARYQNSISKARICIGKSPREVMPDLSFSLRQVCQKKVDLSFKQFAVSCPQCSPRACIDLHRLRFGRKTTVSNWTTGRRCVGLLSFVFFFKISKRYTHSIRLSFLFFYFFVRLCDHVTVQAPYVIGPAVSSVEQRGTHSMQQVLATHRHRRFFVSLQVASRSLFCRLTRGESHHNFHHLESGCFFQMHPFRPANLSTRLFFSFSWSPLATRTPRWEATCKSSTGRWRPLDTMLHLTQKRYPVAVWSSF